MVSDSDLAAVAAALGPRAEVDRPLGPLTTYRVGGPAALFVRAHDEADLLAVRRALAGRTVPVLVLGRGSNLLVADAGFRGLVVRLEGRFEAIDLAPPSASGAAEIRAGAAVGLPVLARRTVDAGLTGLEWAVGVPGSVGGAVRMNAGGHGSDMAHCLARYGWLDLGREAGGEDGRTRLAYRYRSSSVAPTEVVLWAEFTVSRGSREAGTAMLGEIVRWRRAHQPGGSNAGSVFTNPPDAAAGRLVEAAGLKGFRLGTAQVSSKHANFVQADQGGSADDVLALIGHVRQEVARACGVEVRTVVRLVGFPPERTAALTADDAPSRDVAVPGRDAG